MTKAIKGIPNGEVKNAIKGILKEYDLCCCGDDLLCNNCKIVETLREKGDYCCPNCYPPRVI